MACGGCFLAGLASPTQAAVVINEFLFDDSGTDDYEFVELYNSGPIPVEIGDWVVTGHDASGSNISVTVTAGTILAPGAYYVLGNTAVPTTGIVGLGQVVAGGTLENDTETIELYNGAGGSLIDAVLYEASPGTGFVGAIPTYGAQILGEVATGYWANHTGIEVGGIPTTSISRFTDGRDTNNNGRDFGLHRPTPGATNQSGGIMSNYTPPNVDALPDGTSLSGHAGGFVNARVFTPGSVVAGLNLNPIPAPNGADKAIIAWDNAGGGNAVVTDAVFNNGGSFSIQVYFDTENMPLNTGPTGTPFTGSETTFYGIGSLDTSAVLEDITGATTVAPGTLGLNGATGIHWLYEKTSNGSEKLYLIDANDGGNSNADHVAGLDWTILQTLDLSATASGWYELGLSIAPDGTGIATFDGQQFGFTTIADLEGTFTVGYRENTQDGTILIPAYLRPATFSLMIPEPGTTALLALGALCLAKRRRS
jgi:hypothetical protein